MAGLALGSLITFPSETARTGGSFPILTTVLNYELTVIPSRYRMSRSQTISSHMSRLLRQGPNPRGRRLDISRTDGGGVLTSATLRNPTFSRIRVTHAEVLEISREKDTDRMMRSDVDATQGRPKIRCFQGHTMPVTRTQDRGNKGYHLYLIHAADAFISDAAILRDGTKQTRRRNEFHFLELVYDSRQAGHIVSNVRGRPPKVWLVLDTRLAENMGTHARNPPTGPYCRTST